MFGYYVRLATLSFRRTPGLTALMVLAIAVGIGVCVVSLTVFHAMSGNPIWWKSDQLYTVTMDSFDVNVPADDKHPELPPDQLTYRDATYLQKSGIPKRSVIMYATSGVLAAQGSHAAPWPATGRIATADFFQMFEVPFQYGGGWRKDADENLQPVVVLSKKANEKLFGGANSVGRTVVWNDREFRVIGVLDAWQPRPRYYDLISDGHFAPPEDIFMPWGAGPSIEQQNTGNTNCWKSEKLDSYANFLNSECVWLQMWVELPDAATRERMQSFMDAYWAHERASGRFQRPRNNRLTNVDQWLVQEQVVSNDNRMLVGLAFAFLAVCLINTVGLLLAKFLNGANIAGIRRALGATRRALFAQHLIEVSAVAFTGALLGLGLGALGLYTVRLLYRTTDTVGGYQELAHFDVVSIFWAAALAIGAALVAGIYPAWRIGRVEPATYLKNQ